MIVVEHDREMMESADYIVDMGPKAGRKGGEVTAIGTIDDIKKSDSLTAQYLNGTKKIQIPEKRREGNGKFLTLKGCMGNNLKKVDVSIPLGMLVCVTAVSYTHLDVYKRQAQHRMKILNQRCLKKKSRKKANPKELEA